MKKGELLSRCISPREEAIKVADALIESYFKESAGE